MRYTFECYEHGIFEREFPIKEGPPQVVPCLVCYEESRRIFEVPPIKYNTQGFHTTDYDSTGDRLEKFNKSWSKRFGEDPPPPAKDVPKNLNDIY